MGVAAGLALNRARNPELQPEAWPASATAPFVEIIIPARDEERNIVPLLQTLVAQRYPADRFRITVIDDASTDHTLELVKSFASRHSGVRVVQTEPLPAGWTGKNFAMFTGYVAASSDADYLLFLDADTRHVPLMLSTLVLYAHKANTALLSLVLKVDTESFWEKVMVPQAGELYTLLVGTMDAVNSDGESAAANGQCMLITPAAYRAAIDKEGVRRDVAEDRAIAGALKAQGLTVRLEYGRRLVSARVYSSLGEMWRGYSKTMFWASGHNTPRTLAVLLGLSLYAFMPLISLAHAALSSNRHARSSALRHAPLQLLPMFILRTVVCRQVGVPARYALAYPLAVAVGNAMLISSWYRVVSGKGVQWKGRLYR
jgi:chlorobactene glucosyltransferase